MGGGAAESRLLRLSDVEYAMSARLTFAVQQTAPLERTMLPPDCPLCKRRVPHGPMAMLADVVVSHTLDPAAVASGVTHADQRQSMKRGKYVAWRCHWALSC